ncbi:hypothetical protein A7U60_g1511 [Sanghuangporus baumii]|uniref:Uncharacterized protein n=1 Tax=Sanghuangporus baumii TaxID=108892 RepID=A0A9Q5I3Y0_SANBA|nr:hypothetical protein A7U60_g1511 [Sanghuangporus baumii]
MVGLATLGLLFLSFAFGIIGMSVGINALEKSNDLKDVVRENATPGVTVDIDTSGQSFNFTWCRCRSDPNIFFSSFGDTEAFDSAVVLAVGCGLLALTSLLTFLAYVSIFKPVSRRPVLFASLVHWFLAVWIFASLVAFDVIAVNRSAKVAAFLGETQLPDSVVQQQEQALGVSPTYWDHDYIKLLAILPWFAFLFAVIVGLERFFASKHFDSHRGARTAAVDAAVVRDEADSKEDAGKRSVEKRESV